MTSDKLRLNLPPAGLILTPGAGANRNHATLIAIDKGITEISITRLTLGTTSVPAAVKKIRAAGETFASKLNVDPEQIAYGGRSFGGRACSVAVAEGLPACALVLLSYPLHPPGKPDKLRVDHFNNIHVPVLLISGDKDPFGSPEEFSDHAPKIKGPSELQWVKGNHSPKGQDQNIIEKIRDFFGLATE